jgi:hypothetical protein
MAGLVKTITADLIRFQLGGLLATAVGVADLFFGTRLGRGVDVSLVVGGLAALGVHLADFAPTAGIDSGATPLPPAPVVKQ